ncbi:hypothetical protein DSO57_1004273 [Entomophthora muscae]|uniref:Uncharacterized protein n=1 Tax=Entomophthora muscae TaxID=34485 RepID=A0ACC2RZ82_9FUNG|nr:hypothetical protein DSO57_1004273 [Entomophthora muscae]
MPHYKGVLYRHQGGWKSTLKREIGFNLLSTEKVVKSIRASSQTGTGGLAAPNCNRATSSNATDELGGSQLKINDFCWVIQQIQYQLGLLNNLANKSFQVQAQSTSSPEAKVPAPVLSSSPDSHATL